jgi:hypothetical protein
MWGKFGVLFSMLKWVVQSKTLEQNSLNNTKWNSFVREHNEDTDLEENRNIHLIYSDDTADIFGKRDNIGIAVQTPLYSKESTDNCEINVKNETMKYCEIEFWFCVTGLNSTILNTKKSINLWFISVSILVHKLEWWSKKDVAGIVRGLIWDTIPLNLGHWLKLRKSQPG